MKEVRRKYKWELEQNIADSLGRLREAKTKDSLIIAKKENLKRLEVLKKNFKYDYDSFNSTGWYLHKYLEKLISSNKCCLSAHVNATGIIYLESQYCGDEWMFHTQIKVKITDTIYESEIVETFNKLNVTRHSEGRVWENVRYFQDQTINMIKAIYLSKSNSVKVRFIGRQYYKDIELSNKEIIAIAECYELSELIKNVRNK
jgi:hypothetical protein